MDFYQVLDLRRDISQSDLNYYAAKKIEASKELPPLERAAVTIAAEVLTSPSRRAEYDIMANITPLLKPQAITTSRTLNNDEVDALDSMVTSINSSQPAVINNYYGHQQNSIWHNSFVSATIGFVVAFLFVCGALGVAM